MGYDLPIVKLGHVDTAATKIILEFALDVSNCYPYFGTVFGAARLNPDQPLIH
jgi:hypothetical protein